MKAPVGIIYLAGFAARGSESAYRLAPEDQGAVLEPNARFYIIFI